MQVHGVKLTVGRHPCVEGCYLIGYGALERANHRVRGPRAGGRLVCELAHDGSGVGDDAKLYVACRADLLPCRLDLDDLRCRADGRWAAEGDGVVQLLSEQEEGVGLVDRLGRIVHPAIGVAGAKWVIVGDYPACGLLGEYGNAGGLDQALDIVPLHGVGAVGCDDEGALGCLEEVYGGLNVS